MLILTRKENQTIMIGDHIKIELVRLNNNHAVIGIEAPREIKIFRQEIYERQKLMIKKIKVKNTRKKYLSTWIVSQKEISI